MKKSSVSRRKFLTGVSLAAGVAAFKPALQTIRAKGKTSLLNAWAPQKPPYIQPVRVLSRKPGSHLLPLPNRPF